MPEDFYLASIIGLMALVTYVPRAAPLQFTTERWPKPLIGSLEFLPVAIVAAVTIAPMLVMRGHFSPSRLELIAAVPTLACGWLTGNLMASVAVGVLSFILVQTFL